MKLIKGDAEKYQASFKAEQEKLQLDAQQLQGMEANSDQRFQLEAQLEQRSTALKTKVDRIRPLIEAIESAVARA